MPLQYSPMVTKAPTEAALHGEHADLTPLMKTMEEHTGLIHSESMDLSNDPRFFQDSVLQKRLAAFSSLSVVSGLMVGTSTAVISMRKDMNIWSFDGSLQFLSFLIMTFVLFANIIATYVGVAQVYHTFRLETAGPTGFEMATSYYLNPNIVAWRHLAIKCMLISMPMFLVSTGLRVTVNFDREAGVIDPPSRYCAHLLGGIFLVVYSVMGLIVYLIHQKHVDIFRERYDAVSSREHSYLKHVRSMMTSAQESHRKLDV